MTRPPLIIAGALAVALSALAPPRDARAQQQQQQPGRPPSAPIRDEDHSFRRHVRSWTGLRRQNVVMQKRDYSCGAAALATVIKYHWGDDITELELLQEVVEMLTVEELKDRIQKGLSLTDLRRLAVRVGYQATIGRLEFDKLRESKVPLIVGITVREFDHFVVFRGTDGRYVYLADPARGNVRTPIPEFLDQWQKNAVLVVVKPDAVDKVKKSPLSVRPEEISLGQLNRRYARDRVTTKVFPQ
jgi:predicted double-glycine peptidase